MQHSVCIKLHPIRDQPKGRSRLDSRSWENWPILFTVCHPISIHVQICSLRMCHCVVLTKFHTQSMQFSNFVRSSHA